MAAPILKIPVDDAAFKRFLETFAKFRKEVEGQPEAWSGVSGGIRDAAESAAEFAKELDKQAQETRRLSASEDALDKARTASARRRKAEDDDTKRREDAAADRRKHIIDQTREYGRTVASIAVGAGKWALGGGLLGLLTGGIGLFGLDRLAAGVGDARRSAMGFGVGAGQAQGLGINLQRYFDVNTVLGNVANAQANPAQWGAFRSLGVDPRSGNAADLTYQLARAARSRFIADKGNLQLAQAQGLTQFFSPEDLRRMASESTGQFNASLAQSQSYRGLSDDVGRKWQNFTVGLETAVKNVENTLVTKLSRLEPALEKIIAKFGDLAVKVLDRIDFDALGRGLDKFASYITSPQFQADFKTFVDDVSVLAQKIASALKFLGIIPDTPNPGGAAPAGVPNADIAGVPSGRSNAFKATFGHVDRITGAVGTDLYESDATRYAASQFKKWGWSDAQVKGLLSNLHFESNLNPLAVGDNGSAYGIAQWHADRQAQYAKLFGHSIKSVRDPAQALREQLSFIQWELANTHSKAGRRLKSATSAYGASSALVEDYERPKYTGIEKVRRGVYATTIRIDNHTGNNVAVTANSAAGG